MDLTDRECSKLLGSLIGGLCLMADKRTVRRAVRFWAESDDLWQMMTGHQMEPPVTSDTSPGAIKG
jgi:hypothetical protein